MGDLVMFDRFVRYWFCGAFGGALYELATYGGFRLPCRWKEGQLRLGVLASMLLGIGAAIWADGNEVTAFTAALGGPLLIEALIAQSVRAAKTLRRRRGEPGGNAGAGGGEPRP